MSPAIFFTTLFAAVGLVSCATVSKVGQGPMDLVKKSTEATTTKVSKFSEMAANKIRPAGVPVVEVREKDLKPLPTGHEQALAFENSRKRSFWSFMGPVDFKEPTLPEIGGEMDGSLLPPKMP
jgi:hypothetical protein